MSLTNAAESYLRTSVVSRSNGLLNTKSGSLLMSGVPLLQGCYKQAIMPRKIWQCIFVFSTMRHEDIYGWTSANRIMMP